jgi:iron complex outermembrane recepter protein
MKQCVRFHSHPAVTLFLVAALIPWNFLSGQEKKTSDTAAPIFDTIYRQLEEVVITGTRVNKRIIDIPYSVSRMTYTSFQFDRKIGADEMLSSIPGLFLQSRYGNHDVRFTIRGFGSRSNSGIRGVRILLDDIPESEPDGQTRIEALDFNSIGKIEVVKGNASSLYTNAPGGVANFINDIEFTNSSVVQFNEFGSFGLRRNGIKAAVRTDHYGLLTTYSYHNYEGYREHNNEYWHILNMVAEVIPSAHTNLKILGYYVDGMIKLPGSLTKEKFDEDPYQADQRSIDRDEKRFTRKGRLGIRYDARFGRNLNNDIEITAFGNIKYFERTAKDYRIISRNAFGFSGRYINRHHIGTRTNEISFGADLYSQPARIENYDNIGGQKGDQLLQLVSENISNYGFYFTENFEILKGKMYALLTGRYDYVGYRQDEETLPLRSDSKTYGAFTPKLALNYKIRPLIAVFGSFGFSFDSPANNEMESIDPAFLYNKDLKPQKSMNSELGIKGNVYKWDAKYLRRLLFEATLFDILMDNEIVPFEVLGDVFYRNAAKSNRLGAELGAQLEILRDLNLGLTYTYSYFTYIDYEALTIEADTAGNLVESWKDFSGNYSPSVPRNNLLISLSYAHSIGKHISIFAKASGAAISGLWVDDENTAKTDSYFLLNGLVGFDAKFGHFNILLSGGANNLLDEVYVGFTNTNSADKKFYEAGAPRDYFITLNLGYRF